MIYQHAAAAADRAVAAALDRQIRATQQVLETLPPANRASFNRGPLGVLTVLQGKEALTLPSTDGKAGLHRL